MRKVILGLMAATTIAAPLAIAGAANATVAVTDGIGHVDKGDVQKVLGWNNSDFDQKVGSLKFTTGYTSTFDNVLTCGANADNKVVHVPVTTSGTGELTATPVKSGNGKQVNGWDLTRNDATITAGSNDLNTVMQAMFTACLPDKPYTEMTPEELRRLPVDVKTASTPTVTFDGLKVNGVALPNTPVAAPAV